MWTIFKVFVEFVTILLLFYFEQQGMWDLRAPTGDWTSTPALEVKVLTTGLPGKSPNGFLVLDFNLLCHLKKKQKKTTTTTKNFSNAGKNWGQEEKRDTEDEIVGWHHQLNGREFEQTLGYSDRTEKPGVLESMGLQGVRYHWQIEQWKKLIFGFFEIHLCSTEKSSFPHLPFSQVWMKFFYF